MESNETIPNLMGLMYRAHPWHGVSIGDDVPEMINIFIETVPSDTVKYELDKKTGLLKVDRPQKFSNICPTLYGLIPQTFCSDRVADLCMQKTGRKDIVGDEDPLDVCVLSEKVIEYGDIIVKAAPIGGLRMIDSGEADDKIIAVMKDDALYGQWKDISDCPDSFVDRLKHYFLTYKDLPDASDRHCEITHTFGKEEAFEVIARSREDYQMRYGDLSEMMSIAFQNTLKR